MKLKAAVAFTISLLCILLVLSCQTPEQPRSRAQHSLSSAAAPYIDAHNHLSGGGRHDANYSGAGSSALSRMRELGIRKMLIMPPPFSSDHPVMFA